MSLAQHVNLILLQSIRDHIEEANASLSELTHANAPYNPVALAAQSAINEALNLLDEHDEGNGGPVSTNQEVYNHASE